MAEEWSNKWEVDARVERAELECVSCLSDVLGADALKDPLTCSTFIQDGATAFMANGKGKGKGKGKGGKYPVRPFNLTIEDRRKKLQELKAKTECKDCVRKGHWKGDNECTMTRKTAHLAVTSVAGSAFDFVDSDDECAARSAFMAVQTSVRAAIPVPQWPTPMPWTG